MGDLPDDDRPKPTRQVLQIELYRRDGFWRRMLVSVMAEAGTPAIDKKALADSVPRVFVARNRTILINRTRLTPTKRGFLRERTWRHRNGLLCWGYCAREARGDCRPTESSISGVPVRFLRLSRPADAADHGSRVPAPSQTAAFECPVRPQPGNYRVAWDPCRGLDARLDMRSRRTVLRFAAGR